MTLEQEAQQTGAIVGCGTRLREAREAAGLTTQDIADRLKMPLRAVHAMEREDWESLGAPVFVRGQLRSYGRLLGLSPESLIAAAGIDHVRPVQLTPRTYTPKVQVMGEQLARRAVYVVLTAAFVVPVWLAISAQANLGLRSASLDAPVADAAGTAAPRDGNAGAQAPLKASMTPSPARPQAPALRIRAREDAWIQITGSDGSTLDSLLLEGGQHRDYAAGQVARVVLGNATAVDVEHNGNPIDTSPWQRANVARFTVSSDGSPTPVEQAASSSSE